MHETARKESCGRGRVGVCVFVPTLSMFSAMWRRVCFCVRAQNRLSARLGFSAVCVYVRVYMWVCRWNERMGKRNQSSSLCSGRARMVCLDEGDCMPRSQGMNIHQSARGA